MKIRQFAYVLVASESMRPDEITDALAIVPSSTTLRASRSVDPPVPRANMWRFEAAASARVDELISELVERLEPSAEAVRRLAARPDTSVGIQVVRYFDDPEGDDEEPVPDGDLEKLAGQHQHLGFHLDPDLMFRLHALSCALDVDEYG